MPQKTVSPAREQKGNRDLSIALDQVDGAAFLVQSSMLMLSQPIEPLIIISTEAYLQVKQVAVNRLKGARGDAGGTYGLFLGQQFSAAGRVGKTDDALWREAGAKSAIAYGRPLGPNSDLCIRLSRRKQHAHQVIANPCTDCCTHAQTITPPGFDLHRLMIECPDKRIVLLKKALHKQLLSIPSQPLMSDLR